MDPPGDDPEWWATYVTALAPVTGRDEEFILWRLPYARGLRYLHAVAVANGVTMELESGGEMARDSMRDGFQDLKARWGIDKDGAEHGSVDV